jgi:hypothetical protein
MIAASIAACVILQHGPSLPPSLSGNSIEISLDRISLQGFYLCSVHSCTIDSAHVYYGGENLKYYLTHSPPDFLTRRAALRTKTNSIGPQPAHTGEGWGAVYMIVYIIVYGKQPPLICPSKYNNM